MKNLTKNFKNPLYFSFFLLVCMRANAQTNPEITPDFMEKHTFRSMEEALKNPSDVYFLNLNNTFIQEFPIEILKFTNLRELNLEGYN